jgi:hypothetical protein
MKHRRVVAVLSFVVLSALVLTACNLMTLPTKPSAEDLCATAANAYFCGTSTVPQDPTLNANGYNGYCMIGAGNGLVGYSGITGTGGATPVMSTSQEAWAMCGANGVLSRGACVSVVRCTHK